MVRFVCPRIAALSVFCLALTVTGASAQDHAATPLRNAAENPSATSQPYPGADAPAIRAASRPGALVPLYVSFGALQVLDTHSTSRALARGGVEVNPLMRGLAHNEGAVFAVKAASTAGVIYVSEKMWKKNRTAAVIFMVASTSAMTWIVQSNYRAVR